MATVVPRSESFADLSAAIARAQAAMRHPAATKINPRFHNRYSDLADVIDDGLRRLTDEGISITPHIDVDDDQLTLTLLLALGEQWTITGLTVPLNARDAQAIGSALTYARRYLYLTLCGVATGDDDDGEAAVRHPTAADTAFAVDKLTPGMVEKIRSSAAADGADPDELERWVLAATVKRTKDLADVRQGELSALRKARQAWIDRTEGETSPVRP